MNTRDLIEKCRKGDQKAQKLLFDQLSIPMMGVCLRYLKTKEDAEDILLEGFHKMFRGLEKLHYKSEISFFAWVKKIMINESLMKLRKEKEIRILSINEEIDSEQDLTPLDQMAVGDLLKIIQMIPVGYRTVFNLYEVEGYSHGEIAEVLQISEGTSKSQLFKAKKLLRELLVTKNSGYGT
ncbi:MAG: sigma-70 family RNA polymerase sigma factor [Cyclobacteriaceae bacterium]